MSLPNEVVVSTSKLTALGDAIRSRFGVSGELTLDEMAYDVENTPIPTPPLVPSEYQQVDYVASSGTQYINTGYIAKQNTLINSILYIDSSTPIWYAAWGATSSGKMLLLVTKTNNYDRTELYAGGSTNNLGPNLKDKKVRVAVSYDSAIAEISPENFKVAEISTTHTTLYPLGLFAGNDNGTFSPGFIGRIYDFQIFEGSTEVMHFIPCYRKSDNEIGMYDIINDQFYTNAGSGSFTCYPAPSN